MRLDRALRFAEVVADETTPGKLVQRLAAGESLKEICDSLAVPYQLMAKWVTDSTDVAEACGIAERLWVDHLVKGAVRATDAETDSGNAGLLRTKNDIKKWIAARLDRERYGDRVQVAHTGGLPVLNITIAGSPTPQEKLVGEGSPEAIAPPSLP